MRIGLTLIASIFAIALWTGEPQQASAQSCAGTSCAATASCAGSSVGRPVRGLLRRAAAIRPVRRLFGNRRGCNG